MGTILGIVGMVVVATAIFAQHQAYAISTQEIEKNMTPAQKAELNKILSSRKIMGQIIAIGFKYTLLNPNFNATTGITPAEAKQASTELMHIPEVHDFFARNRELLNQNQTLMEIF